MHRKLFTLAILATVVWAVVGVCAYGLWVRGCRTDCQRLSTPRAPAPRVEAFGADVTQSSRAYDTAERGKRRGKAFWNLVSRVMSRRMNGAVYTRDDILRLFGDPDLELPRPHEEALTYFFDGSAPDDQVVYVRIDSKGVVSLVGVNASSAEDHGPPWRPYAGSAKGQK